jgi:hypothetical protein
MLNRSTRAVVTLIPLMALQACTTTPPANDPALALVDLGCTELHTELAEARESQRLATEAVSDAWHVVVPFWVAARYASARSDLADAQGRSTHLQAALSRKGCDAAPAGDLAAAPTEGHAPAARSGALPSEALRLAPALSKGA